MPSNVDLSKLTPEQQRRYLELLRKQYGDGAGDVDVTTPPESGSDAVEFSRQAPSAFEGLRRNDPQAGIKAAEPFAQGVVQGASAGLAQTVEPQNVDRLDVMAGELAGTLLPFGMISKGVRALPTIGRAGGFLGNLGRGLATGGAFVGAETAAGIPRGEEFDPVSAATEVGIFAGLDVALHGAGKLAKLYATARKGKKFAQEVTKAAQEGRLRPVDDVTLSKITKLVDAGGADSEAALKLGANRVAAANLSAEADAVTAEISGLKGKLINPNTSPQQAELMVGEVRRLEDQLAQLRYQEGTVRGVGRQSALEAKGDVGELAANEIAAGRTKHGPGIADATLTHPVITRAEEQVVRDIPLVEAPSLGKSVDNVFETAPRMHERFGTTETMLRPVQKAQNDAAKATETLVKEFDDLLKVSLPKSGASTASNRIMKYAVSQQTGGAEILSEMGVKEIPKLTAPELEVYNWMRGKLTTLYDDLNKARISSGIQPFPKVENYFSFFRAVEGEMRNGVDLIHVDANKLSQRALQISQSPFRFGKKRIIDSYGPVQLDAFGVFRNYARSANKHKFLTPQVARVRQMLDGKFHSGAKLAEDNPGAYKHINEWINYTAGVDERYFSKGFEGFLSKINQNLAFAVLSANARSALIQPTALVGTLTELGVKYTRKGVVDLFNKDLRAFAKAKSNHLAGRDFDVAASDMINTATGLKQRVGKAGLKPLQVLDMQTAMATWLGAFKKGQQVMKMTEKEAVHFADDIVIRTQASAARSDISPIQRSASGKFATTFQTFVINNWGFLTRDVLGMGNVKVTNKDAMKKVMRYVSGATMVNLIYESGLGMRSPLSNPVRGFREGGALGGLKELAEPIPMLGGGIRYGSSALGAGVQLGEDWVETLRGRRNALQIAETIGKSAGVTGTVQARKIIQMLQE